MGVFLACIINVCPKIPLKRRRFSDFIRVLQDFRFQGKLPFNHLSFVICRFPISIEEGKWYFVQTWDACIEIGQNQFQITYINEYNTMWLVK